MIISFLAGIEQGGEIVPGVGGKRMLNGWTGARP